MKLFRNYIATFKGLSKEVWWLALITLINRAGTMVIPFLSLYLTKDLDFSFSDVAWIMSAFGLGSVVGAYLGGKLTDRFGFYKVMIYSLFLTGLLFISLQFLNTFISLCLGIFLVMLVADSFRPAMMVAMSAYSTPENKTRSITLIRLAINLGFSAGPAVGGIIITTMSYSGLFWIDGLTCILATLVLIRVLHPKKSTTLDEVKVENPQPPKRDKAFIVFLVSMTLFGIIFLQYFSTIPIYYKDVHQLTEFEIGLLMGMNGMIIFLLEMPLIKGLEMGRRTKAELMLIGALLVGASFFVLNLTTWIGILIIGMLLMTVGEMIIFPFSNAFAMERASKGNQGEYLALYNISFSIAHIGGHNAGLQMIDYMGYENTWYIMSIIAVASMLLLIILRYMLKTSKLK
ncbi:MAG: MFS transporter [Flavobacteriaceae bacterium]|nr:MFS transporter [Bacteroidia bacterium]NNK71424.1 MFS transporter [Flavobacteriaceae bacterium]NNL80034.1 MFS transporter [Flavobacteriaceae bacterium]